MEKHQDTFEKKNGREQSRKYMQKKRYMQKRLIKTFFILLVMTGIGVTAVMLIPKEDKGKVAGKGDSMEASAKPAEKEDSFQDLEPGQENQQNGKDQASDKVQEEDGGQQDATEVRAAVLEQAELRRMQTRIC